MHLRLIGSAVGVSVGDTVFRSEVRRRVALIPGYSSIQGDVLTDNFSGLNSIQVS